MIKALITGVTGQDGSYLAELLLNKEYEVHGMVRRSSSDNLNNIEHLRDRIVIHYGDVLGYQDMANLVWKLQPDELYNLAGQSDVGLSWQCPEYTRLVNANAVANLLDAVRIFSPQTRFYQASTSEMFGNSPAPQNEETPLKPVLPYGSAKTLAHNVCRNFRENYGLHVSCGILFNHESERRGVRFVTRKITKSLALIDAGRLEKLELGNLDAQRDWGYAPDYVEAMWMMLQCPKPGDYVIGTGQPHSIQSFLYEAFSFVGLDWQNYVVVSDQFKRPTDIDLLCADSSKAHKYLGWSPTVNFTELVRRMVVHDMAEVNQTVKV